MGELPAGDDVKAGLSQDGGDRLLTADEHQAVQQAGLLYTFIAGRIVARRHQVR